MMINIEMKCDEYGIVEKKKRISFVSSNEGQIDLQNRVNYGIWISSFDFYRRSQIYQIN